MSRDGSDFGIVERNPVYGQVAQRLRQAILTGNLAPGATLPTERVLAESFGVSRASVREAVRVLQVQGLVTTAGNGRAVTVPTADGPFRTALEHLLTMERVTLDDLVEVRCALEGRASALAARRRIEPAMSDARAALDDMAGARQEIEGFDDADVRFHIAIVKASGNRVIHVMMLAIRDEMGRHLRESLRMRDDVQDTQARLVEEHWGIYQAVVGGDAELAGQLVTDHISSFYGGRADGSQP